MVVGRLGGIGLALALLFGAPVAHAHAFLEGASPAVGSSLPGAPSEVSLHFTEAVEPRFSRIVLLDKQGGSIATGAIEAADGGRRLSVALPPLPPGAYTVIWHATSVDTHRTEGQFTFTVVR